MSGTNGGFGTSSCAEDNLLCRIFEALYRAYGPQHWWPGDGPFEVAVGAVLTQNTAWRNVEQAIRQLKKAKALDPKRILHTPRPLLEKWIRPAGFFRAKARKLKELSHWWLRWAHKAAQTPAPRLRESLLSLWGIGPETADAILLYAFGHPVFVVDEYTRRILRRHDLIGEKASYEAVQALFHRSVPPHLFGEYHALLVRVGKYHCRKTPRCEACPLLPLLGPPR